MAEPLTGKSLDGSTHARPPDVERAIDVALQLPRGEVARRLSITSLADPDFIRDEVVVHLVRLTVRDNNEAFFGKLFLALRTRIVRRLPRGDDTTSERIREFVVDVLTEMITRDRRERVSRLDIFECRFEMGMKRLITDAKRRVLAKAQSTINVDMADQASVPTEIEDGIRRLAATEGDIFSDPDLRSDLPRAIAQLPDNERRVATLMLLGLPDVDTVAGGPSISREMGRSPRMIQEYRKAAVAKLRRILVEGEEA
jgi:hypothetical protein